MTTFQEFQATRLWCEDLGAALSDDELEGSTGYTYLGCLYIEDASHGFYHLLLENESVLSADLESLERRLFEYAGLAGLLEDEE